MESLVRSFNALPRSRTTPTGLPNHWVFKVGHVPLDPPGDIVVLANPQSRYLLQGGPTQILSLPTATEQAEAIAPLLLEAFLKDGLSPMTNRREHPAIAPWTWATQDQPLATALEQTLQYYGVKQELCRVCVCTPEEQEILAECWTGLLDRLQSMVGDNPTASSDIPRCQNCHKGQGGSSEGLRMCNGCRKVWYCNRGCQRSDWKRHKPACRAHQNSTAAGTSAHMSTFSAQDAHTYYNTVAHTSKAARDLAKSLNFRLPSASDPAGYSGTARPLRRLVITGKDTTDNLALFFGPHWQASLQSEHDEARLLVLLDPPRGSPEYAMRVSLGIESDGLTRSPRPASESELQKIAEVRRMQAKVREKVGEGRSPEKHHMMEILTEAGPNRPDILGVYTLAINTMDQGVRIG